MYPDFHPIVRNAHLLTILGNFWRRKIDEKTFPPKRLEYRIDDCTTIVVFEHQPAGRARAQIVFLHGLEGSAQAGYIASFAQDALKAGFGVHRVNLRTCGGTEHLCETSYHSGLTSDTRTILERMKDRTVGPVFLVGFSLGGNVALKLAGELGETDLISGACAVSTPIDLAACVRCLGRRENLLYSRRFLGRLRERIRLKSKLSPHVYTTDGLDEIRTVWDFDDRFTAPLFGFGTAANYYETQSAIRFLDRIRIPALVIASEDDPLVPFEMYKHPAFQSNPNLKLISTKHGGHLGFISKRLPRFWLDAVALQWMDEVLLAHETSKSAAAQGTSAASITSF